MDLLKSMLTYRRPARSKTETEFIERFILPLPRSITDQYGNVIVNVGDTAPTTLFSCHTDTVHKSGGKQRTNISKNQFIRSKGKQCLGADDTAGVWLMMNMIDRGINGLYIFHRDEEIGGLGSTWIRKHNADLLVGIHRSIAFDRRGVDSVITHQTFERCCSDKFALRLCDELAMEHELDDGGTFTDNENYSDVIPENTNVSVGYYNAHSKTECLDALYLFELIDALSGIDFDSLPTERDPSIVDSLYPSRETISDSLYSLVVDFPEIAAEILYEFGLDVEDFQRAVMTEYTGTDLGDQFSWRDGDEYV